MLACEQSFSYTEVEKLTGVIPTALSLKKEYGDSFFQGGLNSLLYTDLKTYLTDDLMLLADRTTMAYSIEGRMPYLHHPLVEFAYSIPSSIKAPGGNRKWLLKEIAKDYLPMEVLKAPKMGFCSPIQTWANNGFSDFAYSILNSEKAINREIWIKDAYKSYVKNKKNYYDHFDKVFSLLVLELFFRIHIDNCFERKEDIKTEDIYNN